MLRLVFCIVGIYACFLTWGLVQERVSTTPYGPPSNPSRFKSFIFLNVIQSFIASLVAFAYLKFSGRSLPQLRGLPLRLRFAATHRLPNDDPRQVVQACARDADECCVVPPSVPAVQVRVRRAHHARRVALHALAADGQEEGGCRIVALGTLPVGYEPGHRRRYQRDAGSPFPLLPFHFHYHSHCDGATHDVLDELTWLDPNDGVSFRGAMDRRADAGARILRGVPGGVEGPCVVRAVRGAGTGVHLLHTRALWESGAGNGDGDQEAVHYAAERVLVQSRADCRAVGRRRARVFGEKLGKAEESARSNKPSTNGGDVKANGDGAKVNGDSAKVNGGGAKANGGSAKANGGAYNGRAKKNERKKRKNPQKKNVCESPLDFAIMHTAPLGARGPRPLMTTERARIRIHLISTMAPFYFANPTTTVAPTIPRTYQIPKIPPPLHPARQHLGGLLPSLTAVLAHNVC
ncbi:hypothetical protein BC936DRAFT_147419 [Jimgerdemannia flammicorona]|uniref:UDP-galactose transporter homolog 1 n=1 Tax=Jimgerdemannia flammicorona TaxID=994334 RepID=A0A433D5B8_9FUNG|nr:hypothetical protein BC936DRAFT_147419 [Jimgerdemannia flammicorona]